MRKFLNKFWAIITAPFRLIWKIVATPFRGIKKIQAFLNEVPEEHSLIDTTASAIQSAEARASLMDHVEALRKHIFREFPCFRGFVPYSFALFSPETRS